MASRSLTSSPARFARFRLPLAAVAAAAVVATVLPAATGAAAPTGHLTIGEVQSRIAALNTRAEKITESYDAATTSLQALQRKERITNRQLAHDRATLDAVEKQLAKGAVAAYKSGGLDPTLSLVTSGSAQTYLDRASSLDVVARYEASQVSTASAAQRAVAQAQVLHDAQVAQQRKALAAIASQKRQIQSLINQQQSLLSHLRASQRRQLAAQHATAVQQAVQQRTTYHPPSYSGPASGRAATAVRFAYAQLGKPYQWGGAGPSAYDCSGLTMRAWGAAGVGLPHNAAAQQSMLPSVSLSALLPGDLVFYGSPAYHVAIYIGGGRIIQAPHTGANVEISPVGAASSAGRP